MPRAPWCGDEVYAAAARFKEQCLRADGSLFTPSAAIWTAAGVREVHDRVAMEKLGSGSFISKLQVQVEDRSPAVIQLCAEMLYVLLLDEFDTGGDTKREHVTTILLMLPSPIEIPADLDAAFDAGGVANHGASKQYRDAYIRFQARLVKRIKTMPQQERSVTIDDPWALRAVVDDVRTSKDGMPANSVLHLLYPDSFDSMISEGHRGKLIAAFSGAPGVADAGDADRKIAQIRKLWSMDETFQPDFYDDPFKRIWSEPVGERWSEALHWAARLYARDDFDATERTYKLEVGAELATARDALMNGRKDWTHPLRAAITDRRNNLTSWRAHDAFLSWCERDPEAARRALADLWSPENWEMDDGDPLGAFLEALPKEVISGTGSRLSVAALLLMGIDATRFPHYKPTAVRLLHKVLGIADGSPPDIDPDAVYRPEDLASRLGVSGLRVRDFLRATYPRFEREHGLPWRLTAAQAEAVVREFGEDAGSDQGSSEARYVEWVELLQELRLRLLTSGTELRDLLDAQCIGWWLVQGLVPEDWSADDRAAFEAFRSGPSAAPAPGDEPMTNSSRKEAIVPPPTHELASKVYLRLSWLERLFDLLEERRQLILYGPPGTGKTFIAQQIGRHFDDHGGASRLVQFHPSYTYEDFFEGYRPTPQQDGALGFELVPGTLREIAGEAEAQPDRAHLLIIDEINRGNIAKVFGELYYLLEYRDEAIRLQYSRKEEFRLPSNLYVIGTMNTADRSIALVDSALRRRFYFLGLIPTREPVDGVLEAWLEGRGLDPAPAAMLRELNRIIADEDFAIGPSYFMTPDGDAPDLRRVWDHSIMPLLEERYYGTGRDLDAEFGLAAIREAVAAAADANEPEADDDTA